MHSRDDAIVCDFPYPVVSVHLGCGARLLGILSLTFETVWWSHLQGLKGPRRTPYLTGEMSLYL